MFCLGTSVFPGLEQGLAGPLLAFVIKFCWNTVTLFCLPSVYGYFYAAMAEVNMCNRDKMACKG